MSKVSQTIALSDTIDQWGRKVHINVRNGKATMVYRWKDTKSNKKHVQRTTLLSDKQAFRLLKVLTGAVVHAVEASGHQEQAMEILNRIEAE